MQVSFGQVQAAVVIVEAQEALLDERQQRSVIPDGVGDVMRLGKGRDCHKWNAESQLVKAGALVRVGARWIRCHRRAEQLRVLYAGVRSAEWILGALRSSARLLAKRRIG